MKAIHNGKEVEVWKISKTGEQPDWVRDFFKSGVFVWDGFANNKVKIIANMLKAKAVSAAFSGIGAYQVLYGNIGDFIDLTNGDVLSPKKFAKKYEIVQE